MVIFVIVPDRFLNSYSGFNFMSFDAEIKEVSAGMFDSVLTSQKVPDVTESEISTCRGYCKEDLCNNYGKSWACPPGVGTEEECLSQIRSYSNAALLIKKYVVDYTEKEKVEPVMKEFQDLCRKVKIALDEKGIENLTFADGKCFYCKECACITGEKCRFPEFRIPSISGYGIVINKYLESIGRESVLEEGVMELYGIVLLK